MYSSSGNIEIGATLRKAREELGVTFDDVEDETKIRKRYLVALEREDYRSLPSPMYARGFLKTYANYLGLDGEGLSQELKRSSGGILEPRENSEMSSGRESFGERQRPRRGFNGSSRSRRRVSLIAAIGFAIAFVLIAIAAFELYGLGQDSRASQNASEQQDALNSEQGGLSEEPGGETTGSPPDTTPVPGQSAGATPGSVPDSGQTTVAPDAASPAEKIIVRVTVAQVPAWLNVQTDGGVVYEQVAQPGFSQTFEAGGQIQIWTGNAGAIRLEVNGQDYGALGAPGEVERRLFTLKPAET